MLCYLILVIYFYLKANAFRTLRWLFSMERNRRLFKKLFPPALFENFIDIKHYVRDIKSYMPLVHQVNSLPVSLLQAHTAQE